MRAPRGERSFATFAVLWVAAIGAVVVAAVQSASFRQAGAGREAIARTRAAWAARAGLETAIAAIEQFTDSPDATDAFALQDDVAEQAEGALDGAEFILVYTEGEDDLLGAADAHGKLNVNVLTADELIMLPYMTEDVVDSILDWIDADDDTRLLGAESGYYLSLPYPYEPRNGPIRHIAELELIAGVDAASVRGEDWNLNGRMDPEERDGEASWPPDNGDEDLDAGWSGILTCASVDGGYSASGEARIDLRSASDAGEIASRVGITQAQSEVVLTHGQSADASMGDFIRRSLPDIQRQQPGGQNAAPVARLTNDELATLLEECTMTDAAAGGAVPGRLNINTCRSETLEYLPSIDPTLADAILYERESRAGGFTSIVDLLEVPQMTRNRLAQVYDKLDVRTNAFVVCSRGRDVRTGLEVEMVATIDRSTLPATLKEVLVR